MSTANSKVHSNSSEAPTTHKMASVAHDAIEDAARKVEPIEQQLREQAHKAGEQMEATQAAAMKQVEQSMKKVETFVREQPVAATGLAFAAGAVFALILRR